MTHLMVGDYPPLLLAHHPALLLQTRHDPLYRLLELGHPHSVLPPPGCKERRLVYHVGQVRPDETGGHGRQGLEVHILGQPYPLGVDPQDLLPPLQVGAIHQDVAIEAARAKERRVEDLGPVGSGHEDDALLGVKAVHLHQELVQGLLPLVMSPYRVYPPRLPQGIELVYENDAGGLLLSPGEEVPNPSRPHPYEHLDELRTADAEEGDLRLSGHGPRQKRLTTPRWPHQQHPLGEFAS